MAAPQLTQCPWLSERRGLGEAGEQKAGEGDGSGLEDSVAHVLYEDF